VVIEIWELVKDLVFDVSPNLAELNFPEDNGISNYYSPNILKSDAILVSQFLTEKNIIDYSFNSRLWKSDPKTLQIKIAGV